MRAAAHYEPPISYAIGLKLPLFDNSAEQAVTPTIRSISARKVIESPAFERGGRMLSVPSAATSTFMKMLNVVGIASGGTPNSARFLQRFSKQLGCGSLFL